MTQIVESLSDIRSGYTVLYCDLWGCLHDGVRVFPEAVAALRDFRSGGGFVVLLTNSPRPNANVASQLEALGAPRNAYDLIVSSGDAAQEALAAGHFGRRVHHIGPERDLPFFADADGAPFQIERVPLEVAEGIVCTGLFDDRSETPEDYRATLMLARERGLKLLCANPDVAVDVGTMRIYCAGAIAQAYTELGGRSHYFGKPHPPIYRLARVRLEAALGHDVDDDEILCLGDGIATDILGAAGEDLDSAFVTGGLAAGDTGTTRNSGPDPKLLAVFLATHTASPRYAMAILC